MTEVVLSEFEHFITAVVGVRRRMDAMRKGRQDRYGKPAFDLWGEDIEAAAGEAAVSKLLGRWWLGSAFSPAHELAGLGDSGDGVEVRTTWRSNGRLIIHPEDSDDALFYLAVGSGRTWNVLGPMQGRDCKRDEWWFSGDGRPAYFVPQEALGRLEGR